MSTFRGLDTDTASFFKVLPGSDTLRIVIASKVILVEGPSDSLIIQRAYKDKKNKLPIQDGIDIIVTNGLTFKRFYEIAKTMNKSIAIVTDNDLSPLKPRKVSKGISNPSLSSGVPHCGQFLSGISHPAPPP